MLLCFPAVYLVLQTVILSSSKGNLQSKDPVAVSSAVRNLRWLMSRDLAVRFVEKGLVPDLVALVQPGTDASKWCLRCDVRTVCLRD